MEKLTLVLLFHFFGIIYADKTVQPKTLYEESVTKYQAAEALSEIQSKNALPLVLFKDQQNKPHLPSELKTVAIINGKMVHGTTFLSPATASSHQRFLCPEKNSQENCLVRKKFKENEPLQCASEVIPHLEYINASCGAGGIGHLYETFYKICDKWNDKYRLKRVNFYKICYDGKQQRTIFSYHKIISPRLLNSKLLFREREINYNIRDDLKFHNVGPSDEAQKVDNKPTVQQYSVNSSYDVQKLVPAEDLALGLWRKTTFQRVNTALQHVKFIKIWNEICDHIHRKMLYNSNVVETEIYTGVFDIDSKHNMWVKLVYYHNNEAQKKSAQPNEGIAILMNNFVDPIIIINAGPTTSNEYKKAINEYCDQDLCVEHLKKKFEEVRGKIRCCPVTKKILNLFGHQDIKLEASRILNVTAEPETLYEEDVTKEQVANSIREIQLNEVLPIILSFSDYRYPFYMPTSIYKTEIINKRIMPGSSFSGYYGTTMFFCPMVNTDEKCLAPIEFNEYEPLQCAKEAIPMIKKLSEGENQCGPITKEGGSGTLYQVFYEVCQGTEPHPYSPRIIEFYKFCYDANRRKVLFTNHYITSPDLLFSKLLMRERAVEYPMVNDEEFPLSDLQEFQNASTLLVSLKTASASTNESAYKLQKLVPSEDMAFALWRKTTYKYINIGFQHEKLIALWNDISHIIRDYVYKQNLDKHGVAKYHTGVSILTGVFDIQSMSGNNAHSQISDTWVKIIYDNVKFFERGVVILMDNFIVEKTNNLTPLIYKENSLEKYCKKNLCAKTLQDKFEEIGGRIRCCRLTTDIIKLFNISDIDDSIHLMKIPDIINSGL